MKFVAEFGSKHNGIPDKNSDRDLIIISDDCSKLNKGKFQFEGMGYSVTMMSESRANYLSNTGSLFLKHIIDECLPMFGNSFLIQLSKSWKHGTSYEDEIASNVELLELLQFLPKNIYSLNFANDLIIISIRNILIRKLAMFGDYTFGWSKVFQKSIFYGYLNESDIKILWQSKKFKNAYRIGCYPEVEIGFINSLISILSKISHENLRLRFANKKRVLSLADSFTDNTYKQLRAIELMCCFYKFDSSVGSFKDLIRRPNYFCGTNILTKRSH